MKYYVLNSTHHIHGLQTVLEYLRSSTIRMGFCAYQKGCVGPIYYFY